MFKFKNNYQKKKKQHTMKVKYIYLNKLMNKLSPTLIFSHHTKQWFGKNHFDQCL